MNLPPNVERLELARQDANESYRHHSKPVPPNTLPWQPDPSYRLPAPTIAAMVRLCRENRRNNSNGRRSQ